MMSKNTSSEFIQAYMAARPEWQKIERLQKASEAFMESKEFQELVNCFEGEYGSDSLEKPKLIYGLQNADGEISLTKLLTHLSEIAMICQETYRDDLAKEIRNFMTRLVEIF